VCPHFRVGDRVIRTITVAARFEYPLDVTLASCASSSRTRTTRRPSGSSAAQRTARSRGDARPTGLA
jgi:hypothetical protein